MTDQSQPINFKWRVEILGGTLAVTLMISHWLLWDLLEGSSHSRCLPLLPSQTFFTFRHPCPALRSKQAFPCVAREAIVFLKDNVAKNNNRGFYQPLRGPQKHHAFYFPRRLAETRSREATSQDGKLQAIRGPDNKRVHSDFFFFFASNSLL